jgi:hypothetical protein
VQIFALLFAHGSHIFRGVASPWRLSGRVMMSHQESPDPSWSVTARGQWTIPDVYFDTAGWRLAEASATRMSWIGAFGGTMTLGLSDVPEWTADPIDLDTIRHEHRSRAAKTRGGLVSAEIVELPGGAIALEVITKHHHGTGFAFDGRLYIEGGPERYILQVACTEERTGVRESIVNGLRLQLGEIDLFAMMSGPIDPGTGGRTIPGMRMDPYDSTYDDQATYSASDDDRIDEVLQTHPLSVVRSTFRRTRSSW